METVQRYVLVGTYRFGDGTVRVAADEYHTEEAAWDQYRHLAGQEQWWPNTRHTAEVMTRVEYDDRYATGNVPAEQQLIDKRFDGVVLVEAGTR